MPKRQAPVQSAPHAPSTALTSSHDGLILHCRFSYALTSTTPHTRVKHCASEHDHEIEFESVYFPPLFLLPSTWARYEYNMQDIYDTYSKMDSSHVWMLSLLYQGEYTRPDVHCVGVRASFEHLFKFVFISRRNTFESFLKDLSVTTGLDETHRPSILCQERPDHKPLLPLVSTTLEVVRQMAAMAPERRPSFCYQVHYPRLHQFKDIWLAPLEYDPVHELVYMVRAVPKVLYDDMPVLPKPCPVTLPVVILVGPEREPFVLLEEACFLTAKQPVAYLKSNRPPPAKRARAS